MFVPVAILTEVNALVAGFQTRAFFPANDCPSYARTSPVGSRMAFTATMGQEKGAPHWPTRSGVPATTVTETGALVAVLLLASRATAVRTWFPELPTVSQTTENGEFNASAPSGWPSTKNCTPATPTLSEALAYTETRPNTEAPATGALIATVGGVVSEGGGVPPPTAVFMSAWISAEVSARL